LSDNPTRVRISFTVDLNEVPERIACLLEEVQETLETLVGPLGVEATDLCNDGNAAAALDFVTNTRLKLMGVDLRLEDCQNLLTNYQATQLELALEKQKEEEIPEIPGEVPETLEELQEILKEE